MNTNSAKVPEHRAALHACVLAREVLRHHDLPGLLEAIENVDAKARSLDPTVYREKVGAMAEDAALLRAALVLRDLQHREPRR